MKNDVNFNILDILVTIMITCTDKIKNKSMKWKFKWDIKRWRNKYWWKHLINYLISARLTIENLSFSPYSTCHPPTCPLWNHAPYGTKVLNFRSRANSRTNVVERISGTTESWSPLYVVINHIDQNNSTVINEWIQDLNLKKNQDWPYNIR